MVFDFAANNLEVDALFVYTKTGHMASLLSRCRPDCPIFAFTTTTSVRRRLNLQWGLIPFRLSFSDDMESNLNKTFSLLKARNLIKSGDLVIAVSDMLQSIQVMNVPWKLEFVGLQALFLLNHNIHLNFYILHYWVHKLLSARKKESVTMNPVLSFLDLLQHCFFQWLH